MLSYLETPVRAPAVGDEPVRDVVLRAPADDLDGVPAEEVAAGVLVHARLVVDEVLVDLEAGLDGPVLHDLVLDLGDPAKGEHASDGVGVLGLVHLDRAAVNAGRRAGLNGAVLGSVGDAGEGGGARVHEEPPHVGELTTLATAVGAVAGDNVLGGKNNVHGVLRRNAEPADGMKKKGKLSFKDFFVVAVAFNVPVGESLRAGESPA